MGEVEKRFMVLVDLVFTRSGKSWMTGIELVVAIQENLLDTDEFVDIQFENPRTRIEEAVMRGDLIEIGYEDYVRVPGRAKSLYARASQTRLLSTL